MMCRRHLCLTLAAAAILICTAGAATAGTEVINFEGLPTGFYAGTSGDPSTFEVSTDLGSGPILVRGLNPGRFGSPDVNAAVIFDSDSPTGYDFDLGSPNETCDEPGPGIGFAGQKGMAFENCPAFADRLHKVLIVDEWLIDRNRDGLIDFPDDEGLGPNKPQLAINFDFSAIGPVRVEAITFLDVGDSGEAGPQVQLLDGANPPNVLGFFQFGPTGNNGLKPERNLGPTSGVMKMSVALRASGAIDDIVICVGDDCEPSCGDGNVDPPGETCDPPGSFPGGGTNECRDDCTYCGDGIPNGGEECDFADPNAPPGCRDDCTIAVCGDGIVDPGEECDDGNDINDDGCRNDCTIPRCDDGIVDPPETCDPPGSFPGGGPNECRGDCTYCGDGIPNGNEQCDDGNLDNNDGCRNDCTLPRCGDGIIDPPDETCDPPGSPGPGSSNLCRPSCTYCGDGIRNNGEECDPRDPATPNCTNDCKVISVCALEVVKTATPDVIIPRPGPDCDTAGDPTSLTFRYTGGGCAASSNSQDPKKTSCDGQIDPAMAVTVSAAKESDGGTPYDVSPTTVNPGEEFTVSRGGSKLASDTWVFLSNGGGNENNRLHTSCSQPLKAGDVYGSLTLVGINGQRGGGSDVTYDYVVSNGGDPVTGITLVDDKIDLSDIQPFDLGTGGSASFSKTVEILVTTTNTVTATGVLPDGEVCMDSAQATVTVEDPPGSCADGKPQELIFEYTGDDCTASNNGQGDKAKCSGDPADASPIKVTCTSKDCTGSNPKITVSPSDESVNLGGLVSVAATGRDRLHSNTKLELSQGGVVLQSLEIHTSCSQPLVVGDQYGSLILREFIPEQ